MRYVVIAVSFLVATVAASVWQNRNAELETSLTRPQVFAHCVVGVGESRYTATQFMPCLRAGFHRAAINRHHERTLRAQKEVETSLAEVDAARDTLTPWTD